MAQSWNRTVDDGFVDMEQIIKRLEWLDNERRKDKSRITALESRITDLNTNHSLLQSEIKDLQEEFARFSSFQNRIDLLDHQISQLRIDAFRQIEERDKTHTEREKEIDSARRNGLDSANRTLSELRKSIEPLQEIRKTLLTRNEEYFRLNRMIEEVNSRIESAALDKEEYNRFQKTIEENRKQDAKRVTDVHTEMGAYRKRIDEMRGRVDLVNDNLRKVEQRMNELLSSESERKQSSISFQEKQSLTLLEFEKTWQEWKKAFDEIVVKAAGLETQMQSIENTQRSVKRSQDTLDEVTNRFDRRTNELVEMERLMEEKLRQEWSTFKEDNQKRWQSYQLGQEEILNDQKRTADVLQTRIQLIEDNYATQMDDVNLRDELYVSQMQELYTMVRGWLEKMGKTD
ncbi:hypothetical protein BEQ56_05295 [Anaerolineaceae bacterium oral taxon 439]|nr:hypothetical protein BEQ56_05295 [Anaerolineaceae bacterium oral taxon 439]